MALASSPGGSANAGPSAAGRARARAHHPPPDVRARFVADLGFELDDFQRRALDALDTGSSVVVAAPTGSGKTAVAHYAIELALAGGGKAFYTTPLKALSNQKYAELARRHGRQAVGLLTGDNAINGDAPVVVMTTEVLRNMIYAASPALTGLRYVVLDEVHYLQNAYRGPVWEEVIIHAPPEVDLVCLSATVSNAEELADWIRTVRGETAAVIEDRRPVELHDLYLLGDRGSDRLLMVPTLVEGRPNPEAAALDAKRGRSPRGSPGNPGGGRSRAGGARGRDQGRPRLYTPRRSEVTELLWDQGMLPAIYFIFSRAACDDAVTQCVREGARLTTSEERRQIRALAEAKVDRLTDEDLRALNYGAWLAALESGYAAHHAGLVPPFKEAVEACFAAGLVKAVFATETLSLGINMPARTVIIENLTKWSGERHQFLTPGEYTQLTGRAGRRGIDSVGYAVVLWSPWVAFDQVASLVGARSYALTSSFRPTYNMAANLVRRYPPDVAHHLLNLSFAQYRSDSDLVHLEAQLERATTALADARAAARCERGDVDQYRRLVRARDESTPPRPAVAAQVAAALDRVRPGDVVEVPGGRRGGRVVVISTARRKGGDIRVRAVTPSRHLVSLGPHDFPAPPRPVTRVALPVPYEPRSPAFVRGAALALRRADAAGPPPEGAKRRWRGEMAASHARAAATHPVARCPEAQHHVRARDRVDRLLRETERLRRLAKGRSESLARQFDRVLQLLEGWGYVQGWGLTEPGQRLARLYHECDLLVAECMERGLFDGLGPAELAAVVSAFTYESRGSGEPSAGFPTAEVRRRWLEVERVAAAVNSDEHGTSLPLTRPPDPGFMRLAHAWASGGRLAEVIDEEGISGGDFVRNVKQLMDLLGQLGQLAPDRATAGAARVAGDRLFRGVIAASAVVEGSPTGPAGPP